MINLFKNKKNIIIFSILLSLIFFGFYSYQSLKLFTAHKTRGDLTNFAQAMWNTTQGRIMQNTFNYSVHNFWGDRNALIPDNSNIFGIHFNPILFLFIPFYLLYPYPQTLVVIQAFTTATAGFVLFYIARDKIKSNLLALILQISFFTHIAVLSAVLSEFHAYTLSLLFGLILIYTLNKKGLFYYSVLILFLFIQENTPIGAFLFGLYLCLTKKTRLRGVLTSLVSVFYFLIVTQIIIPHLSNFHAYIFGNIYGSPLGNSMRSIILSPIIHPLLFMQTVFSSQNFNYVSKLILSTFPFTLMAPLMFLVGLGGLSSNLLSSDVILKSISMHYESLAIPFFYYAAILGILNLKKLHVMLLKKYFVAIVFFIILITTLLQYKFLSSQKLNKTILRTPLYSDVDKELDSIIRKIPVGASVSTQDYISGNLTQRRQLYLFPVYSEKVDYLLLSVAQSTWPLEPAEQSKLIAKFKNDKHHRVLYESKNFILMKRE